jgi:tetratricopeptide (TPR) repeat protein
LTLDPGQRLATALADRYRIERELGAGGMATVYLAHDLKHDRPVAIKVLHPHLAAVLGAERFLKEIRTTAQLQHPHILPLHDSGEADGLLFYVMLYVEGESLGQRITREKQLPVADAVRITSEVASALEYAHRRGVIHRDIKPENILLHEGSVLVADFGIALAPASGDTRLTEAGMSLGTPSYMSPEQALGERELDARSDIYAVGALLYELLTGAPPFTGPTAQAIIAKTLTEKPVPPSRLRKAIPRYLDDTVLTALEKDPANRFATAEALQSAVVGDVAPPRRGGGGIRRLWWAAVAGLALLGGALAMRSRLGLTPTKARRAPFEAAVQLAAAAFDSATLRTPQGCTSAIRLYSRATEMDTLYAEAWGGLAKTYALCALFTGNPDVDFPLAKSASATALALDNTLASAYTASGMVQVFHEQNFPAAQRNFALALKYDPTAYEAWLFRAWAYLAENQPDSAEHAVRAATALPHAGDATVGVRLATMLRVRGDLSGTARELTAVLAQYPGSPAAIGERFELDVLQSRCDSAREELPLIWPRPIQYYRAVGAVFWARCGQADRARRYADSVATTSGGGNYVDFFALAMVYASLHDSTAMFRSLNAAVDDHNWALFFLGTQWAFQPYRNTPEYADIMRRAHVK